MFVVAAVVATIAALIVGSILARRIARPIERLADAAQRTAQGDLRATAPVEGPAEVRALANAFNVMVDRLAEQDAVRREFVVNASHELRTPLTNLQGYLEALRDGVLPPDPATFDSLREEVDRLTRLASSLDALAGVDDERPMPEDLDLGALVRSSLELASPSFARRSIAIESAVASGIVVHARSDELAQVVSNLLQNAIRYTPSGGTAGSRSGATRATPWSASRTPAATSRPRTCPASGSGSSGSSGRGIGRPAARASGSRS